MVAIDGDVAMSPELESPFHSIESAYDFVELLIATVTEAKQELETDTEREAKVGVSRRLDALRVALYNLEKLELHLTRSRRLLNDLRTWRRLLFEERTPRPVVSSATSESEYPQSTVAAQQVEDRLGMGRCAHFQSQANPEPSASRAESVR